MDMMMSWILTGFFALSLGAAMLTGSGGALSAAVLEGAQSGVTLAVSIAGSLCLWSGVGALLEKLGVLDFAGKLLRPLLRRLFPEAEKTKASGYLCANLCANFLGLGNAATPMGIEAARRLSKAGRPGTAGDSLCRLVVLNTASIQLIPANVAAVRASLGCETPFDLLPAVWLTSLCSAGMGLAAAWLLGKVWRNG